MLGVPPRACTLLSSLSLQMFIYRQVLKKNTQVGRFFK